MIYGLLADLVMLLHGCFMLFVGPGGFLLFKWPKLAWLHVPSVVWAVEISFLNHTCPLTPLEQYFRRLAGQPAFSESFTSHYIEPMIYPQGLTQAMMWGIGTFILVLNVAIYLCLWRRRQAA